MDLPLNGRSYFSLVALSPNVTSGFVAAAQAVRPPGRLARLSHHRRNRRAHNLGELHPGRHHQHRYRFQYLHPAAVGGRASGIQGADRASIRRSSAGNWGRSTSPPNPAPTNTTAPCGSSCATTSSTPCLTTSRVNRATTPSGESRPTSRTNTGMSWADRFGFRSCSTERTGCSSCRISRNTTRGRPRRRSSPRMPAAMRTGDFSSILSSGYVIYDPNSRSLGSSAVPAQQLASVVATQSPFPGNIIPASRISPDSTLLLNKWNPLPNLAQTDGRAALPQLSIRLDDSDRQGHPHRSASISTRAPNRSGSAATVGTTNPPWRTPARSPTTAKFCTRAPAQWVLSNVRTLSPTKVNEARFGYNNLFNNITQQLAGKENVDAELGMPVAGHRSEFLRHPQHRLPQRQPGHLRQPDQQPVPDQRQVFRVGGQLLLGAREALVPLRRGIPLQRVSAARQRIPPRPVLFRRPVHEHGDGCRWRNRRLVGRGLAAGRFV